MYGKGIVTDDPKRAGELAGALRGKPVLIERITAAFEVLRKQENVDPKRVAAMGYCFGGTTSLQLAYSGAEIAGAVSFHGNLPAPSDEEAPRIRAKILVLHGAEDPMVPDDMVKAFQDALRRAKVDWQFVAYGGAVHSFTNPNADRTGINGVKYDEKADRRSWQHMKVFFEEIFREGARR
jgi:dienelactone hydrolase